LYFVSMRQKAFEFKPGLNHLIWYRNRHPSETDFRPGRPENTIRA
jgi:hypothetical protein